MKKSLLSLALAAIFGMPVRARTTDISFGYRMGAGFPGQINRTHPFSALPGLTNPTNPPRLYGDPAIIDTATNSYRAFLVGDTAVVKVDGVLVRPFPVQQQSGGMNAAIGVANGPLGNQAETFLNEGFIMAKCYNFATQQPTKNGAVYVWIAASSGVHVQGGFESVASGGSTAGPIQNMRWNGPADASGVAEIQIAAPMA